MSYLLDTNVVSELVRPRPSPSVIAWIQSVQEQDLHLSVLTIGELRYGADSMVEGARRERLRTWLAHDLPVWFANRLFDVDAAIADRWGRLQAEAARPLAPIDSSLAATALHHGLRMVTRNVDDFRYPGLEVVNPWQTR